MHLTAVWENSLESRRPRSNPFLLIVLNFMQLIFWTFISLGDIEFIQQRLGVFGLFTSILVNLVHKWSFTWYSVYVFQYTSFIPQKVFFIIISIFNSSTISIYIYTVRMVHKICNLHSNIKITTLVNDFLAVPTF